MENIKWFGHASFQFVDQNGNKIYYVDPFDLPAGRQGVPNEKQSVEPNKNYDVKGFF